jgi:hypothetical protein
MSTTTTTEQFINRVELNNTFALLMCQKKDGISFADTLKEYLSSFESYFTVGLLNELENDVIIGKLSDSTIEFFESLKANYEDMPEIDEYQEDDFSAIQDELSCI